MLAEQRSIGCERLSQLLPPNTLLPGQNHCSYGRHFVVNEGLLCSNLRALVFGNSASTGWDLVSGWSKSTTQIYLGQDSSIHVVQRVLHFDKCCSMQLSDSLNHWISTHTRKPMFPSVWGEHSHSVCFQPNPFRHTLTPPFVTEHPQDFTSCWPTLLKSCKNLDASGNAQARSPSDKRRGSL